MIKKESESGAAGEPALTVMGQWGTSPVPVWAALLVDGAGRCPQGKGYTFSARKAHCKRTESFEMLKGCSS